MKNQMKILSILVIWFLLPFVPANTSAAELERALRQLQQVQSWAMQLQTIDVEQIATSPLDMVVIDYSKDGSDRQRFTADDIKRMQRKPDGSRRLVLSYLSIGEAETYRYYWQSHWKSAPPVWLGTENPNWPGNYLVRFWDKDWQEQIAGNNDSYLSRIEQAGFDGIYLDRIDVYSDWLKEHPQAEAQMIDFVGYISSKARRSRPGFIIIGQNAEELLRYDAYRARIDAVSKEDLLYGLKGNESANSPAEIAWSEKFLRMAQKDNLPVFGIEYLRDKAKISRAKRYFSEHHYRLTIADRPLDTLCPLPAE